MPRAKAEAEAPTSAGVFGMTRMSRDSAGKDCSILAKGKPATIEMSKCLRVNSSRMSDKTALA